jgi:hypothetical protein
MFGNPVGVRSRMPWPGWSLNRCRTGFSGLVSQLRNRITKTSNRRTTPWWWHQRRPVTNIITKPHHTYLPNSGRCERRVERSPSAGVSACVYEAHHGITSPAHGEPVGNGVLPVVQPTDIGRGVGPSVTHNAADPNPAHCSAGHECQTPEPSDSTSDSGTTSSATGVTGIPSCS